MRKQKLAHPRMVFIMGATAAAGAIKFALELVESIKWLQDYRGIVIDGRFAIAFLSAFLFGGLCFLAIFILTISLPSQIELIKEETEEKKRGEVEEPLDSNDAIAALADWYDESRNQNFK